MRVRRAQREQRSKQVNKASQIAGRYRLGHNPEKTFQQRGRTRQRRSPRGSRVSCGESRCGGEAAAIQCLLHDGCLATGAEQSIVRAGDIGRISAAVGAPYDQKDGEELRATADKQGGADSGWAGW